MTEPSHRTSENDLDQRLKVAREAASYKAWADIFSALTEQQRQHLARLLAHKWHISGVVIRNKNDGCDCRSVIGDAT